MQREEEELEIRGIYVLQNILVSSVSRSCEVRSDLKCGWRPLVLAAPPLDTKRIRTAWDSEVYKVLCFPLPLARVN